MGSAGERRQSRRTPFPGGGRMMVTRWGMSDQLGTFQLAPRENPYLTGWGGGYDHTKTGGGR
jgi:hypothetical protein